MPDSKFFIMAGGGTGGHVIPALAVAREMQKRGHQVLFLGSANGVEARLVPAAGFPIEFMRVGGIKNLGVVRKLAALWHLGVNTIRQFARFGKGRPAGIFSMGGYVAGPPVLAALARRIPVIVMEPNAVPGFTNRWIARYVYRALVSFPETGRFFPPGRTEVTGLPVREEFFRLPRKEPCAVFTVLITGGSQGSRTLNNAARASWPLFRQAALPVRLLHQTGLPTVETIQAEFARSALAGEVNAFIEDMPAAFAQADLIVCRSGAGALAELAAAGKASVLIPFPFAADQHQLRNAQAFERDGAAILFLDRDWTGQIFFDTVTALMQDPGKLRAMGEAARTLAHPGAAQRAAQILEEIH